MTDSTIDDGLDKYGEVVELKGGETWKVKSKPEFRDPPTIDSEIDKFLTKFYEDSVDAYHAFMGTYTDAVADNEAPDRLIEAAAQAFTNLMLEKKLEDAKKYKEYYDHKAAQEANKARIDPFDFVEPCESDCSPERHAYHQGQWDMAVRINKHFGLPPYPGALTADKEQNNGL